MDLLNPRVTPRGAVTCVGSRSISHYEKEEAYDIGRRLAKLNFEVYSGNAIGSDWNFELGSRDYWAELNQEPLVTSMLPEAGFNNTQPSATLGYYLLSEVQCILATQILKETKIWPSISRDLLHGEWRGLAFVRNIYQVKIGFERYTDACVYFAPEEDGVVEGGTRIAVYYARYLGLPTYNLRIESQREAFYAWLDGLEDTYG